MRRQRRAAANRCGRSTLPVHWCALEFCVDNHRWRPASMLSRLWRQETVLMQVRTIAALILVSAATALGVPACGGAAPATSGPFIISVGIGEPKHLVPSSTTETSGHQVI